jgi:hypothetical protein
VKVLHWVVVGPTVVDVKHEPLEQFMALEKKHVPEYDPHSKTDHEAEYDPNSMRNHEAEYDLKFTILPQHRLPHHLHQV